MAKYISIAISGQIASGTTTAAQNISKKLQVNYKSAGDFFRDYMRKHSIALHDKESIPDEVDRKFDEEVVTLLQSNKPIIVEGLYVGYFARNMKNVLKVLLAADDSVRIKRALSRTHTHSETADTVKKRDIAHNIKFRKLYADEYFLDEKFFDIKIDTSNVSPESVTNKIIEKFKEN